MDWATIATMLADRGHEPLLVLDASRTIVIATHATQRLLGRGRSQLVDRPLREVIGAVAGGAFEAFLSGARWVPAPRIVRGTAVDGAGRDLMLGLDLEALSGREGSFVCTILSVHPARTFAGQDVDYEVSIADAGVGTIRRVTFLGGSAPAPELSNRPCFEVVCGRPAACHECPAQVVAAQRVGTEHTSIRHRAGTYEISTAVRTDIEVVRVRLRHLRSDHLRDAQSARIEQLSRDATLSQREREVLEQLLHGAATDEIAAVLGISPRTVKFHQANLLTKLGADSRVDLLRVLA